MFLFRMNAFTKIFTATEEYFVTIPIRQILHHIHEVQLCNGGSARYFFGKTINFEKI